jgi:hypothetical protein
MRLSISEIIAKAGNLPTEKEKIQYLQTYATLTPLRMVLKYTYDKENVQFLIPSTPPPWKKNDYVGVEGMLYSEARRLKIFIKGGGYNDLNKVKREQLFISLLEDIDNKDADMLCVMISQKPFPGLSFKVVKTAFPEDYSIDK